MAVTYLTGDALETVRTMPDQSVDLSTCSPPFLYPRRRDEVRRALTGEQPQVAGQLGLFEKASA